MTDSIRHDLLEVRFDRSGGGDGGGASSNNYWCCCYLKLLFSLNVLF